MNLLWWMAFSSSNKCLFPSTQSTHHFSRKGKDKNQNSLNLETLRNSKPVMTSKTFKSQTQNVNKNIAELKTSPWRSFPVSAPPAEVTRSCRWTTSGCEMNLSLGSQEPCGKRELLASHSCSMQDQCHPLLNSDPDASHWTQQFALLPIQEMSASSPKHD